MTTVGIQLMPNGSMDWEWFHREHRMRSAWREAGLCCYCGERPSSGTMVCCDECKDHSYPRPDRCSFCGTKRGLNGTNSGGKSGPTYPCHIIHCGKCEGNIPEPAPVMEEQTMTPVKEREAVTWAYCQSCGLRYSIDRNDLVHHHRYPQAKDPSFTWARTDGKPGGGIVETLPPLPLPEGVQVRGRPKDGWGDVELPHAGYTITLPDGGDLDGTPTRYVVKRGQAVFSLSLSGSRSWAAWKNKGKHEVAVTRYCATPMAAIDALAASLSIDTGDGEPETPQADIEGLTDRLVDAIRAFRQHGMERTRAALEGGKALLEVREALAHGDFGPYCQTHGIGERTARNWMRLADSGLSAEEIQERGGIKKALKSLSAAQVPAEEATEAPQEAQKGDIEESTGLDATGEPEATETGGMDDSGGKPLIEWTDEDWEEYRTAGKTATVADLPPPVGGALQGGMRRCSRCGNSARRGTDLCRPCLYRSMSEGDNLASRLLRENRKLKKSISGLKWQLNNRLPAVELERDLWEKATMASIEVLGKK